MKKILLMIVLFCSIFFIDQFAAFSQDKNSVLILIESANFKVLSQVQSLKTYYSDDAYLIGEIATDKLMDLEMLNLQFQIIDPSGWSGEYYVLTPRRYGPSLNKINVGNLIYSNETSAVVKIREREVELLLGAGYQLEKITRIEKPLPGKRQYKLAYPTTQDSLITKIISSVSAASLEAAVQRLEDFRTRYTYSDSIVPAGQWIYDQYVSFGYTDVKFDTFYLNNKPHRNVIATKPGLVYSDSVIMLGGHYDSIVTGQGANSYVYAPGADDNASGAVAALEAARVLADYKFQATIKFAAWDAEEVGLLGSAAYAQKARLNKDPISLYMNFDMVANVTPQYTVTIYADAQTMPLAELTANIARIYTSLTPNIPGNSGGSDHRPFQINGYPAYFVQEGVFSPHWHKTTDVTSNMDFEYMKEVVQMGVATAVYLASPSGDLYSRPFVKYNAHSFDDDMSGSSYGNGNGYIDAGETIELAIKLKNFGDSTAYNVTASISSNDPYFTIIKGTQSFGTIQSQAIAVNQNNFVFQVSPKAPCGHKMTFLLEIRDGKGNSWQDRLSITVKMPQLAFYSQHAREVSGNGNERIDPGEIVKLFVELKNTGLRAATGITAILSCSNPEVTILDSLANFTDILESGIGNNYQDNFTVQIKPTAKSEIIPFSLKISEGKGFYQTGISFKLAIGQGMILLIEDDGKFDLSHYYKDALNLFGISYLHWDTEQGGAITSNTLMSFSRVIWYTGTEFNNSLFKYGTSVLENYLENGGKLFINGSLFPFSVRDSLIMSKYLHAKYISFNTKLNHLRSEGPKPVLGNIDFWLSTLGDNNQSLKGEVDALSPAQPILFYDPTTSEGAGNIKSSGAAAVAVAENNYRAVMFSFGWEGIANREVRENVLANILNWLLGAPTPIGANLTENQIPAIFELFQNYPNPFNSATTIQFQVPEASQVTIKIFDILGREMKTLVHSNFEAGSYKAMWDGKDNRNQPVTSGVYFYQITAGDFHQTRKMILLY